MSNKTVAKSLAVGIVQLWFGYHSVTINIAPRHEVRLNDVNWSLIATFLLGNSGYQTDRKIYDHSTPLAILAQSARCGRYKTIKLALREIKFKKGRALVEGVTRWVFWVRRMISGGFQDDESRHLKPTVFSCIFHPDCFIPIVINLNQKL